MIVVALILRRKLRILRNALQNRLLSVILIPKLINVKSNPASFFFYKAKTVDIRLAHTLWVLPVFFCIHSGAYMHSYMQLESMQGISAGLRDSASHD